MNRLEGVMRLSKAGIIGAVALSLAAGSAADQPLLTLRATAVDVGAVTPTGARRGGAGMVDIVIERWTTDDEHARLAAVLREKGPDALLDALEDLPRAGYIRTPGRLGWDLHYAREATSSDGGRRIVFASDRPMAFWELWNRPQSADYQFLAGEVRLRADGKGQGTLVPAARLDYNEGLKTIEVENYASQPVRLTEVKIDK
jgi:hypothetical protein